DRDQKSKLVAAGLDQLNRTRELLEAAGFSRLVVTGSGTGTCELAADHPALTEWQPGSFLFMDAVYHKVCPQYQRSLSVLTSVISRRPGKFVLDAGSKAISQDFGKPEIKNHPGERVEYLAEEHTRVTTDGSSPALGERREVFPSHCCATVNLHRRLIAVRDGVVEAVWPIECSGRYD
ncbi:MAG: hypothetical protein ACKO23_09600, partial [Gemmataceae bacterium]